MRSDRHLDPFDGAFGEDKIPFLLLLFEHCLLDLAGQDTGFIEQQLEPAAQFVDAVVQLLHRIDCFGNRFRVTNDRLHRSGHDSHFIVFHFGFLRLSLNGFGFLSFRLI